MSAPTISAEWVEALENYLDRKNEEAFEYNEEQADGYHGSVSQGTKKAAQEAKDALVTATAKLLAAK